MPADSTAADSAAQPGTVSPVEPAPDAVQQLLHALPWGALQLTAAGTVARLNPAAEALWGVPAAAVLGRAPADVQPAVLPPALLQALTALPTDAPTAPLWLPHTRQWVQLRAAPAPAGGQWVYWEAVVAPPSAAPGTDVAQLLASHGLLQRTIDSSLDMVQVFRAVRDERGQVVDFTWILNNAAAERAHGDVIGRRLLELNPGVLVEGIFDTFKQVLKTGVPNQSERHYVHEQFDGWFYQSTVRLGDGVTTTTHDITARKQAEAEILRLKDELAARFSDKYYTLFTAMDEGYCIIELLYDAAEQPHDWRFLEVNPAFELHNGLPNATGKTVRELVPDIEPKWFDIYGRVDRTGESLRFEDHSAALGRWFSFYAFRIGQAADHQVAVIFSDITARKHTEEALRRVAVADAFRLRLADALGPLTDPVAVQEAVTRTARQHFAADRCYYCEIIGDQAIIRRDDAGPGLPSVAGTYPLASFKLLQAVIEAGQPFSVPDVRQATSVDDALRELCVQLQVISYLDVPVVKHGQPVGVLCLVQSTPREWTKDEVSLAVEVAERTWTAVERARAEEARQLSETRLRTLVANLPGAAVFVVDADLRYQLAEGEALSAAGFAPTDLLGRTVAEAMPPELVGDYEAHYRRALAGHSFSLEHAAHGRVFLSRGVPLMGPAGLPAAVLVVSYDITERQRAEVALRASEEQFRTVVNLVLDLLWRSAAQGHRTWYNQRWHEYTGQTPTEAAGYGWTDAIHPADRADSDRGYRAAVAAGQPWYQEHRIRAAGGEYRWFQVQARPVRNAQGVITDWYGAATDIHARKLTEEAVAANNAWLEREVAARTRALQESAELLQSIYDTSLIGMSMLLAERDAAGQVQDFRIALVNRELERETGRRDLVGKLYKQEFPGIVPSGLFALMRRALDTGEPQQIEYYYPYEGFQKWYSATFVRLTDRDGLAASNLDITERKRAEEERLKTLALLQQSEEAARLGSWEYDLRTGHLHWSAGMYGLFGLPVGSPVSPATYWQAAAPASCPAVKRLLRRLRQRQPLDETLQIQVAGQPRTLRIKSVVVTDEQGQPAKVLGVDVDISDLVRLQAENLQLHLQQQQQQFNVVLDAQEAERQRIAESLHNGVGQTLYATKLQLAQLRAAAPPDAWTRTDALLADAIRQTRALSHELVPTVLHEFGLAAALEDVCRKLSSPQLRFHCQIELEAPLAQPLQVALYRMAQELAQNIVKHARASEAALALETVPGYVLLRAEDNGVGFAPDAPAGLGLRSIRDRVALLGGTVDLGSAEQIGTYVRIRLPLP